MQTFRPGEVHPTAIIGDRVTIGLDVTIGAHVIVHDNVNIGAGTFVGPQSILGEPTASAYGQSPYENPTLSIGEGSVIRSGSIIYAGSSIGSDFQSGHRVTIREGSEIADHCRVGTLSDIQGYCQIGEYTRLHSNVHIGQRSTIGSFVWIFPYTVLTNDPQPPSETLIGPTIDEFAVIATMVVVLPGVRIGRDALVGAHSLVRNDVPAEAVVVGSPAKQVASVRDIRSRLGPKAGEPVYPWRQHFDRGMPWEGVGFASWAASHDRGDLA
jgi:acetyltransferase-like isoleucine patch superfamily enzyme